MIFTKKASLLMASVALLVFGSLCKGSVAVNGHYYFFGLLSFIGPLLGTVLMGIELAVVVFTAVVLLYCFKMLAGVSALLTFGFPTFVMALSWRFSLACVNRRVVSFSLGNALASVVLNVFVPLVCFVLFVFHPVGCSVPFYSLYWLVPVAMYPVIWLQRDQGARFYFASALASTFIAHAVGSVCYLYLFETSPALWIGLIPIVIGERLIMASGITLGAFVIDVAACYVLQRDVPSRVV